MPNGLTTTEKTAMALKMWLIRHQIDGDVVESLFPMSSRRHLVELVDASDSLERLLVACVTFTMQCPEDFEEFLEKQVGLSLRERAYGFS